MKHKIKILIMSILSLLAACSQKEISVVPYYSKPDFTPQWTRESDDIHKIDNFSFTDQDGRQVTNETLRGKIYAANFFFTTCPSVCPSMTKNLMKVQEAFKNDDEVMLLSHTVKPWYDTQEKLKNYEKSYNIQNGKWLLVTGKTNEIYSIARKSYYAEEEPGYNKDSTEFLHTEHVLLIDWNGHIRGVYNGTLTLEIDRMIEDIKTLEGDRKKMMAALSNDG